MKFENTDVWGFKHALRGMRNPKESWSKSDTFVSGNSGTDCPCESCSQTEGITIGKNDLQLAQTLIKAGSEHRKFMRQIFVSVDITAPLYWWKEFDTYKVGTVANSTSTMHKLASTPITVDCFEHNILSDRINPMSEVIHRHRLSELDYLECLRKEYNNTVNKDIKREIWKALIEDLPESWLQTRTVTMNYENLLAICSRGQRRFHKLTEWSKLFIDWVRTLPYAQELIFIDELEEK